MQYKINFISDHDIILPFQYNQLLQESLLPMLEDQEYLYFIHDASYRYEKRYYKLYTFSRIIGQAIVDKESKTYNFKKSCSIYMASLDEKLTYSIFINILNNNSEIRWLNNYVRVKSIEVFNPIVDGEEITVKTVSPITVKSTFYTEDGQSHNYFYNPDESEFIKKIESNLCRKYFAYYGKELEAGNFHIQAVKNVKECHLSCKGSLIKGYTGVFKMTGSKELFHTALSSGIGGNNSMGFGMLLLHKHGSQTYGR